MRWQSVVGGVLALALLEVAVSSQAAAGRVGSLLTAVSGVISRVLSPTVAAIPDLRKKGAATPTSSTSGSTNAVPATTSSTMPADWSTSAADLFNA